MRQIINRLLGRQAPAPKSDPEVSSGQVGMRDAWHSGWFRKDSRELFRGFAIQSTDTVVDVGCNAGSHLKFCSQFGPRIIGIDVDEAALKSARASHAGSGASTATFLRAEAERLPLKNGLASRIICSEVLEHVTDPDLAIAELVRIGAPGALYLVTIPDRLSEEMQKHVAPDSYFQKPNHIRIFERDEMPARLEKAGLQLVSEATYGFYWSVWWGLFWGCDVDLSHPDHATLELWAKSWAAMIETPKGRQLKAQLDAFMPKSRVYIAQKP